MGVKILSLFDGMACGMIAMQLAGVEVESYDAYEIDKYAIKAAQHNFQMIKEHGDVFDADFTQYDGVDFLIGGSPCTYWSIAQTKNRETVASGMGWELFSQYVRALHEANPKYFIYENNKSMSKAIRASIDKAFGFEAVLINSALVSAQNRQRLYWVGKRNTDGTYSKVNVEQPADRGILLKDVLDSAVARDMVAEPINTDANEKAFCVTARYYKGFGNNPGKCLEKHRDSMVAEPVRGIENDTKSRTLTANYWKTNVRDAFVDCAGGRTMATEPINVESYEISHTCDFDVTPSGTLRVAYTDKSESQGYRVYCADYKSVAMRAQGNGRGAELVAEPVCLRYERTEEAKRCRKAYEAHEIKHGYNELNELHPRPDGKTNTLTTVLKDNQIMEPVCVKVFDCYSVCFNYSIEFDDDGRPIKAIGKDGKEITIYEVRDGKITIKGKQYPIKLKDGYYIIRKLTVSECKRLQTVPEWYEFPVSNSQAYKMLGNGWTCEVIAHLIRSCIAEQWGGVDG